MNIVKNSKKTKSQSKKTKSQSKKTKSQSKKTKLHNRKQYGSSIFNTFTGQVFLNTGKKNLTTHIPGSQFMQKSTQSMKYLQTGKNPTADLLSIFYNYKTPNQLIINKSTLNTIYQSARLMVAPQIQINNNKRFLLVMILPGAQPLLLWAINFNNRSKLNTIISYLVPKQPVNQIFKLLFKLYRYPEQNTINFAINDSMGITRQNAFINLTNYIKNNQMLGSAVVLYTITVQQNKGDNMSTFFSL